MPPIKSDLTSLDPELKDLYKGQTIEELVYPDNPIFASVKKDEGMAGRKYPFPIRYGYGTGRSATFSAAQSNISPSKLESWDMTPTRNYALARVDGLAAAATASDKGAFLDAMSLEINGMMKALANDYEISLPRRSTGSRGQVGSVTTNTLTLLLRSDASNFEVGMVIRASATDGAANRTGSEVIAKVDRMIGTLTSTNASWTTSITALVANDYLMVDGDLNAKLSGFADWIPDNAPSSTAFYGVDRSIDTRLGGSRYDGTNDLIKDALVNSQAIASREGGSPNIAFLNDSGYSQLIRELGAKVEFCQMTARSGEGSMAKVGFDAVKFYGNKGPITAVVSRAVPQNRAFVMTWDDWTLLSIGKAIDLLDRDSNKILRVSDDDAYEVRIGGYTNLVCAAPGRSCLTKLSSSVSL